MTKYILHGGATKIDNQHNKNFFLEIIRGGSNILIVQFARKKELWKDININVGKGLQKLSPNKKLNTTIASENTEEFIEQIKSADSIYIMGGNTHILQDYLEKIPNIDKLWTNKTIAGSSAGALVLARYYYENDKVNCEAREGALGYDDPYNEGLDILPYKCFCHYSEDQKKQIEKLRNFGDNTEILTLEETKFIIIETDEK